MGHALVGAIIELPMFFEIGLVLLMPVIYLLARRSQLSLNTVGSPDPDRASEAILGLVVSMGGAIASEHGIGVAKTGWWRRTTDPGSIELARRVKEALDPNRILNPQVFWG